MFSLQHLRNTVSRYKTTTAPAAGIAFVAVATCLIHKDDECVETTESVQYSQSFFGKHEDVLVTKPFTGLDSFSFFQRQLCRCGDPEPSMPPSFSGAFAGAGLNQQHHVDESKERKEGFQPNAEGDYHGLFPKRQLWVPLLPYPLWNRNWDGRDLPSTGDKEKDRERMRQIRKDGVTRHIILIRHGQYDETYRVRSSEVERAM